MSKILPTSSHSLLTLKEASKLLGVSKDTIRRWEKKGIINSVRTQGGHRRYTLEALDRARNKKQIHIPPNERVSIIQNPLFPPKKGMTKRLIGFVIVSYLLLLIAKNPQALVTELRTKEAVLGVESEGGSAVTLGRALDTNFNLSLAGFIEGNTLRSTTNSLAPLSVASNTKVNNLNVDLLDDQDWDDLPTLITKISGPFTLSGNSLSSEADLVLSLGGGDLIFSDSNVINIGGSGADVAYNLIGDSVSGASSNLNSDDDLYIEGNLEVDGTIYGTLSGTFNPGFTTGSIIFQSSSGLSQDNSDLFWDSSNNRLGLGTSSPSSTLHLAGTSNSIQLTIKGYSSQTQNLAEWQNSSGTALGSIAASGDITLGTSSGNDIDLNLYGDISQQASSDLTAISNIKDVYVYDTTKDSDGGKWTNDATSQQLSWYTETKDDGVNDTCVLDTDDRCGRSAFPKKAVIVATSTDVFIFDALDNSQWMNFDQSSSFALGADTNNDPSSVHALDGVIYIGTNGLSGTGLYAINFKQDKIFRYDSTDRQDTGTGRVADRNAGTITYGGSVTAFALNSSIVNDVHTAFVNGKPFVAVATDVDMSVIRPNDFIVYDYSDVSGDDYNTIWLTSQGDLYGVNETLAQLEKWKDVNLDNTSEVGGTPTFVWDESTNPPLVTINLAPTIQVSPSTLFIDEKQSSNGYSDVIYFGSSRGMTVINDKRGSEREGTVKFYDTFKITEEVGSFPVGLWPFNESSGPLQDLSVWNNYLEDIVPPTYEVNGVRGTAITFNGADDHICSDNDRNGTCDVDSNFDVSTLAFYISVWFKHSSTITGTDTILDRTYTTVPAVGDGYRIYMNSTGTITFGIDDDATTFPEDSVTSTAAYNDNQWHHLVAVKGGEESSATTTGSSVFIRLYVDGEEAGAADTAISATESLSDSLTVLGVGSDCSVGANCATGANFWDGSLDELTISTLEEPLTTEQIRRMYNAGKQALRYRTISVTDATTFTSTTIGDSAESWTPNEFVGTFVQIISGVGIGQTRRITKNTATELTVSPSWSTTPDATSDFAINPEELAGSTDIVKAITISDGTPDKPRTIYVGTNNGTDNGTVTAIRLDGDYVTDVYHGLSGRTDDGSAAWDTTSNYDDIEALSAHSDVLAIGAQDQYWTEYNGKSLTEKIDVLTNQTNNLQLAFPGVLTDTHRQEGRATNPGDTSVSYQVIRKGWGGIVSTATASYLETVTYGITYDETPLLFAQMAGRVSGDTPPQSLEDCGSATTTATRSINVEDANRVDFTVRVFTTTGAADTAGIDFCYTWMAIGTYSQGAIASAFPGISTWSSGADLAEWYATNDTTLTAGEIVSIDKEGAAKVGRSQSPYDPTSIGIIATQPALTIGPETGLTPGYKEDANSPSGKAVAVALAGRVPVKVSLEAGPIQAGDPLTTSSTPGVAMKATKAGPIIGKAMESFIGTSTITALAGEGANITQALELAEGTGPEVMAQDSEMENLSKGIGVVMVFVNTSWYDPDTKLTGTSDFSLRLNEIQKWILETSEQIVDRIGAFKEFIAANIQVGSLQANEVSTNSLQVAEAIITQKLTSPSILTKELTITGEEDQVIMAVNASGSATFVGTISSDGLFVSKDATISGELYLHGKPIGQIDTDKVTNLEERTKTLETAIELLKTQQTLGIATESGIINYQGSANELTTLGDTVMTGNLDIGTLQLAGEDNSINAIGALKIQSLSLAAIEFMSGYIKIDTNGNLEIIKGQIIGNESFRGSEIIASGEDKVKIEKEWEAIPKSITLTSDYNTNVWITDKSKNGFTINVSTPPLEEAHIDWLAIW